jgi:hypothetical protein
MTNPSSGTDEAWKTKVFPQVLSVDKPTSLNPLALNDAVLILETSKHPLSPARKVSLSSSSLKTNSHPKTILDIRRHNNKLMYNLAIVIVSFKIKGI